MPIPVIYLGDSSIGSSKLWEGEIRDSTVILHTLASGECIFREGQLDRDGILFIISGNIDILSGDNKDSVTSMTLIRFPYGKDWEVKALEKTRLLEIIRVLDDDDRLVLEKDRRKHDKLLLRNINKCPTYLEEIKSKKTINRMLLPEGNVPRLCIGTVQSKGPDEVGAHEHPMLDQLFLGLTDCHCTIHAEEQMAVLEEWLILHIPLASRHRVSVLSGDSLHYMWIDFFATIDGEKYMTEAHKMNEQNG